MDEQKLPRVLIKFNKLLDPVFLDYVRHSPDPAVAEWREKWVELKHERVLGKIEEYKQEWVPLEKSILTGIRDALGLEFLRNIIVVHIVTASPRSMSQPLVIGATTHVQRFVPTLAHELVHEIYTYEFDGSELAPRKGFFEILQAFLPSENNRSVLGHVLVYAVLKQVFLDDIKRPDLWETTREGASRHQEYAKALSLMETAGHESILREFRTRIRDTGESASQ